MRSFWVFRSNIRGLEDYHQCKDIDTFENNCWDFYLLFPLWLLKNDYFDEVIIWRLTPKRKQEDIIFVVNGKKYIQRWVSSFDNVFKYPAPEISFFRGGFREYCNSVKKRPKAFGKKLYLGAGKRVTPIYGGKYDVILFESEIEIDKYKGIPFYKTANPKIFKTTYNDNKEFDICWPHNFTQISYKGAGYFIKQISKCPFLQSLKIIHIGNKPDVGRNICKKFRVDNIKFMGKLDRHGLNGILNNSKFGLVTSNITDGCPRISTEILSSGTPLLIRNKTRLMDYYKSKGVMVFKDKNIITRINKAFVNYDSYYSDVLESLKSHLSFDKICKKNIEVWNK